MTCYVCSRLLIITKRLFFLELVGVYPLYFCFWVWIFWVFGFDCFIFFGCFGCFFFQFRCVLKLFRFNFFWFLFKVQNEMLVNKLSCKYELRKHPNYVMCLCVCNNPCNKSKQRSNYNIQKQMVFVSLLL